MEEIPESETLVTTRKEAFALIPTEQRFTWKMTPMPGRLLFVDTVGKSLIAMKNIFKSIGEEIGQPQTVCLLDAHFEDDGSFVAEIVVTPKRQAHSGAHP